MLLPMPLQVPAVPVSVRPRWAVPVSVGLTVLTGGALGIVAVAVLAAVAVAVGVGGGDEHAHGGADVGGGQGVGRVGGAGDVRPPSRCHW